MAETPRRRVGAGVAAVCIGGVCCSLVASCGDVYFGDLYGTGSSSGSTSSVGSGGSGGGSTSSTGSGEVCKYGPCETIPLLSPWNHNNYVLLSLGQTGQPPLLCPEGAPWPWFDGYAELVQTTCPVCSCQPPKGICELPTTLKAYYTPVCPAPANAPFQSFDAPVGWDGSCTPVNPIAADPSCSGNTCIQGLTIDPPVVKDPPACETAMPTPTAPVPAHWGKAARMCKGAQPNSCADPHLFCAVTPPPGFMECVFEKDVLDDAVYPCPSNFPNRQVVYKTFADASTCSPCTCDAPAGSKCSTAITVYTTASDCTGSHKTELVDSTKPYCGSVPIGTGLLSKKADPPTYTPGSCKPMGGDLLNPATPDGGNNQGAYTLCCK